MDKNENDIGLEEMAYIASHEDAAKAYNEKGLKNRKEPVKPAKVQAPKEQELEGIEEMAYIAAQAEKEAKKPKRNVRDIIANMIRHNKEKDDNVR